MATYTIKDMGKERIITETNNSSFGSVAPGNNINSKIETDNIMNSISINPATIAHWAPFRVFQEEAT